MRIGSLTSRQDKQVTEPAPEENGNCRNWFCYAQVRRPARPEYLHIAEWLSFGCVDIVLLTDCEKEERQRQRQSTGFVHPAVLFIVSSCTCRFGARARQNFEVCGALGSAGKEQSVALYPLSGFIQLG